MRIALRSAAFTTSLSAAPQASFSRQHTPRQRELQAPERAPPGAQLGRLELLDHPQIGPRGRVQDASVAEPEGDVVGTAPDIAVEDKVAGGWIVDGRRCLLLLPGVARNTQPCEPMGHVDEAGTVDAGRRHPAPLVRGPDEAARSLERQPRRRLRPRPVALRQRLRTHPAAVVVGSHHPDPVAVPLLHLERFVLERLAHLLGRVARIGPKRRDLDAAPHVPRRLRLPPGRAGLRRSLTTPAARSGALGARSYLMYCPPASRLARLPDVAPGT